MAVHGVHALEFEPEILYDANRPPVFREGDRNDTLETKVLKSILNDCLRCFMGVSVAPMHRSNPIPEIDAIVDQGIPAKPYEFIGIS